MSRSVVHLTKRKHVRPVRFDSPSQAEPTWRIGSHGQCHLVQTDNVGTNWDYWCLTHDGGSNRPDRDCSNHPVIL